MNLMDPTQFQHTWDEIDTTDDPREIREAWESDEDADELRRIRGEGEVE